jgi:antitoxin (DNA-binding transcriptional repressor) of toxin-antitoxin stability system
MKTFSIMETQHNLSQVLRVVESGVQVGITRRKELVARIVSVRKTVDLPDFVARAQKIWGSKWQATSSHSLLDETRGDR